MRWRKHVCVRRKHTEGFDGCVECVQHYHAKSGCVMEGSLAYVWSGSFSDSRFNAWKSTFEHQSAATLEWGRGLSPPLTVTRKQDRPLGGAPIPLASPPWEDYDAGEPLQAYRCQSRGRDYFSLKPDCSLSLLTIQVKNTSSPRPGENDWIPYLREPRPNRLPITDLAGGDPCTGNWKEKKGPVSSRYMPDTWAHLSIKQLDIRKLENRKWFLEQKLQAYSTEARRSVADRYRD
jgi:hypothetical protein